MRPVGNLALLAAVTASACTGGDASRPVDQEAGVVRYAEFPPADVARWIVPDEPELSVGVVDGDPEYQFSRVSAVEPLRDGVLVADAELDELRAFDAAGRHLATLGGKGEGPGEFSVLNGVEVTHGDTILAWDTGTRRLTTFDDRLQLVESRLLVPDALYSVSGAFGPRDLLVWPFGPMTTRVTSPQVIESESYFAVTREGELTALDTIIRVPGRRSWAVPDGPIVSVPFTTTPDVTLAGGSVWVGTANEARLARYDRDGTKELEVVLPGREIPDEAVDGWRADALEGLSPAERRELEPTLEDTPIPERASSFDLLLGDDEGNVWVRVHPIVPEPTRTWVAFDRGGAAVGSIELPVAFRLLSVREDHLYGVWEDELGVQTVRVYQIEKP